MKQGSGYKTWKHNENKSLRLGRARGKIPAPHGIAPGWPRGVTTQLSGIFRMSTLTTISQQIWDMKYRLKDADGTPGRRHDRATAGAAWRRPWPRPRRSPCAPSGSKNSTTRWPISGSCRRVGFSPAPARGVRSRCSTASSWARFPDDMSGIFDNLKEAALTMQQGGGIGYDFSTLRPKGAPVKGVGADASGPLVLHGCLGRHVPHHHERGPPPRRHDGDHALRPSRYRGLYRGQAGSRPAAHVQSLGAGDAMPSSRRSRRTSPGSSIQRHGFQDHAGARAVGPDHARDLCLCRAGRDLHRPHQRAEQSPAIARRSARPIRAASSRCRLMARVCWARSIWRGWSRRRSPRRPRSTRRRSPIW